MRRGEEMRWLIFTAGSGLFVCYGSNMRHHWLSIRGLEIKSVVALDLFVPQRDHFLHAFTQIKLSQPSRSSGHISVNTNHWTQTGCGLCWIWRRAGLSPCFTGRSVQHLLMMNILNLLTWLSLTILPLIHASSLSPPPCQILFQCAKQMKVTSCHPFFRLDQ